MTATLAALAVADEDVAAGDLLEEEGEVLAGGERRAARVERDGVYVATTESITQTAKSGLSTTTTRAAWAPRWACWATGWR